MYNDCVRLLWIFKNLNIKIPYDVKLLILSEFISAKKAIKLNNKKLLNICSSKINNMLLQAKLCEKNIKLANEIIYGNKKDFGPALLYLIDNRNFILFELFIFLITKENYNIFLQKTIECDTIIFSKVFELNFDYMDERSIEILITGDKTFKLLDVLTQKQIIFSDEFVLKQSDEIFIYLTKYAHIENYNIKIFNKLIKYYNINLNNIKDYNFYLKITYTNNLYLIKYYFNEIYEKYIDADIFLGICGTLNKELIIKALDKYNEPFTSRMEFYIIFKKDSELIQKIYNIRGEDFLTPYMLNMMDRYKLNIKF